MARTLEEFIASMSPEAQAAVALETERLLKEITMSEISITLTPYFKDLVEAKVQSGRYSDASDVLREALRLFEQHERERESRVPDRKDDPAYGTLGALLDVSVRWHGDDLAERLADVYAERTLVEG
jgi:antitoxin ParD1/3/4